MNERERTTKRASSDENGEDPMEGRLRAVFTEAYPRVKPTESLRQRVAEVTAGYESRNRQSAPWRQLGSMRRWPAVGGLVAAASALLLLAPLAARLMQFAVSRRREALADISGVAMTRYPPGLIAALEKLKDDTTVVQSSSRATAHLWIESPLARTKEEGRLSRLNRLFDTHPPLEERIHALKEL